MDMMDRRIRDAVSTLMSRGAKALERAAGELENAAEELRRVRSDEAEQVWAEPSREADAAVRAAPLRAVPDDPAGTQPATGSSHVPPVQPPRTPDRPRPGDVDVDDPATDGAGSPGGSELDGLRALAGGTVSEIRATLPDLSPEDLRSLREIETANRNRTTLLSAIDRALSTGA